MPIDELKLFLSGAIFMGELSAALLFLASWRRTEDRLFAWFAAAFAVLVIERWLLFCFASEHVHPSVFLVRLMAFVLIIVAIVDRNRRAGPTR